MKDTIDTAGTDSITHYLTSIIIKPLARMRSEGYGSCPVCVCVQASHPLLTQLQDQVDIPMDSVSCSLQNKFGVSRIMA